MDTEERLLERIRQGNRRAQQELYCQYANAAMAVAMRYVADTEAARDVLQEAFIKVLTRLDSFTYKGTGSLKAWIMRVVCNESLGWLKQESRFVYEELSGEDLPDDEPDVGGISMDILQRMIEQLPDGYRTVFNLYVFEQKSHKEIASMLGIKENSSASQYLRAKRLLAKQINDYKQQQL